jgi:hypothetical protein
MKAGLVGLPGSGKTTLFAAITGQDPGGDPFRSVEVPDGRIDRLAEIFVPKKVTYARFEVHDLAGVGAESRDEARNFATMREMDALALVIRGFQNQSYPYERPSIDVAADLDRLVSSFQVADFVMLENRIERLEKQVLRPTKTQEQDKKELALLQKLKDVLEGGGRIEDATLKEADEELIRGFRFLTQKPTLVILNLPDDGEGEADLLAKIPKTFTRVLPIRGGLESEITRLDAADAAAFMTDFGIQETARARLIAALYDLLGLQSFLTAGEDECRAWTVVKGETAVEAAGTIHSDIQRGFIRAEVTPFDVLSAAGGFKEAKAAGHQRLESKDYVVKDGDVINFRFSV